MISTYPSRASLAKFAALRSRRSAEKSALIWVGRVQLLSVVPKRGMPVTGFWLTSAAHTSPGAKKRVKSYRLSALLALRKRSFTALPFTTSVFTILSKVALPDCTV